MNVEQGLVIFGFGGHARSLADVALAAGIKKLLFIDENAKVGESFQGFVVQKMIPEIFPEGWACISAAGDNSKRKLQIELVKSNRWPLATLISHTATIGVGSSIAPGTFIAHHAHVGPMAIIGEGCIINTRAIVEHDCQVGDYSHVSIGASVAGRTKVGNLCSIFAGATLIDSIKVCNDSTVAAGATVISNIVTPGLYAGVPARLIGNKK